MLAFMAVRMRPARTGDGDQCGAGQPVISAQAVSTAATPAVAPAADPMDILRDRFARGVIDTEEYERRLVGLLRSDPEEKMPWWDR